MGRPDARVLMVTGVDRTQRETLRRIAEKKSKRSVSAMIREHVAELIAADEQQAKQEAG